MVNCPLCDAPIDVEEEELDEGDPLICEECGANLIVTDTDPLEIESDDEDEEDDEDEDDEDDDDTEFDDEEKEEDEWK